MSRLEELVASVPACSRWKLDMEIDFENRDIRGQVIPQHLGRIASVMTDWKESIADHLGLRSADGHEIVERNPKNLGLQRRDALYIWKSRQGKDATYRALMDVFVRAGRLDCAETIVGILKEGTETGYEEFSPRMTPLELAQWLHLQYGVGYKNDIDKLKAGLINGELFLLLPGDRELLDDLELSAGFKRLVRIKVSQLESSSASLTTPAPASTNGASLPPTEMATLVPLCSTVNLDEADISSGPRAMGVKEIQTGGDVLSAWVPKNVLWIERKELLVKFLNVIPREWHWNGSRMNAGIIMSWANEWNLRGGATIPKFTLVQDDDACPSDIRVLFTKDGRRQTMLGKKAQNAKYNEATMWLDLNSGGVGDDYKKHIVIHEFGHALGLGHEHQRSDFWKLIKPFVNVTKMKKYVNMTDWDSDSHFKTGKCAPYDPNSVMHYWFMNVWLKNGYSDQSKVENDRDSGILSPNEAAALLGVHLRSSVPLADRPSDMDIQLLKDLYGNTSCTILGSPPTQSRTLQHSDKIQGTRLTLRLLGNLKTKSGTRLNIINQVAPHWRDFATLLDFDPNGDEILLLERKHHGDVLSCCREMMQLWLRGMGRQPATLELLVDVLDDCNLIVLAQHVEEAIPYN